jgi:hypothetical protein
MCFFGYFDCFYGNVFFANEFIKAFCGGQGTTTAKHPLDPFDEVFPPSLHVGPGDPFSFGIPAFGSVLNDVPDLFDVPPKTRKKPFGFEPMDTVTTRTSASSKIDTLHYPAEIGHDKAVPPILFPCI